MVLPLLTFTNALQPSPSARRPSEAALGQHMKVQVLHALAAVLTHIGDNAVAALIHTQLAAKLRNHGIDMAQQGGIILRQRRSRRNVALRDNKEMHRGLRVDVVEGQQGVILIQFV